jgi:predicted metalloprotease with PDZ domain
MQGNSRNGTRPGLADDRVTTGSPQNAAGIQAANAAQNRSNQLRGTGQARTDANADHGIFLDAVLSNALNQFGFQLGGNDGSLTISDLVSSGLAAEAGFRQGDVVTSINGQNIASAIDLESVFSEVRPGDPLTMTVDRDGNPQRLTMTVPDNFQFQTEGRDRFDLPPIRAFGRAGQAAAGDSAAQIQSLRDELQALREELKALRGR